MSKSNDKRGEPRPNSNQKLPVGHFESDGLSKGQQSGPVRKSWDAEQGKRPRGEQSK